MEGSGWIPSPPGLNRVKTDTTTNLLSPYSLSCFETKCFPQKSDCMTFLTSYELHLWSEHVSVVEIKSQKV